MIQWFKVSSAAPRLDRCPQCAEHAFDHLVGVLDRPLALGISLRSAVRHRLFLSGQLRGSDQGLDS
eukprot:6294869-Pyramimonas_sp.AAC.1